MNKLNEFLDTLKIHNKDISCFNDHLAVFKLKRLIKAERTSAVTKAVEEERNMFELAIDNARGLNESLGGNLLVGKALDNLENSLEYNHIREQ